ARSHRPAPRRKARADGHAAVLTNFRSAGRERRIVSVMGVKSEPASGVLLSEQSSCRLTAYSGNARCGSLRRSGSPRRIRIPCHQMRKRPLKQQVWMARFRQCPVREEKEGLVAAVVPGLTFSLAEAGQKDWPAKHAAEIVLSERRLG